MRPVACRGARAAQVLTLRCDAVHAPQAAPGAHLAHVGRLGEAGAVEQLVPGLPGGHSAASVVSEPRANDVRRAGGRGRPTTLPSGRTSRLIGVCAHRHGEGDFDGALWLDRRTRGAFDGWNRHNVCGCACPGRQIWRRRVPAGRGRSGTDLPASSLRSPQPHRGPLTSGSPRPSPEKASCVLGR